ncbi:MAG TPA: hypothetical protein VMU69_16770 [Bradyrhizobium sp.]|nr:hypothetical protein [Bradyrhizobium sp.]
MEGWACGLSLIALTICLHMTAVSILAFGLYRFRVRLERRNLPVARAIAILIVAFTAIGLLLALLHGMEAALWAGAYLWLGVFKSPGTAIFYSADSMTTRGAAGAMLPPHWQMMGALEAADGMLLFGISTAFIFTVMQFYYQHLVLLERPAGRIGRR